MILTLPHQLSENVYATMDIMTQIYLQMSSVYNEFRLEKIEPVKHFAHHAKISTLMPSLLESVCDSADTTIPKLYQLCHANSAYYLDKTASVQRFALLVKMLTLRHPLLGHVSE